MSRQRQTLNTAFESNVQSEDMEIDSSDQNFKGTNIENLDEDKLKQGYDKYTIKLYLELIDIQNSQVNCVEFFPEYDIKLHIQQNDTLRLYDLISELKSKGYQLEGRQVFYFSRECGMYINCGIDPIHPDIHIKYEEIKWSNQSLHIKCATTGQSLIHMVMSEEMNEAINKMKENGDHGRIENESSVQSQEEQKQQNGKKICRRTKERRIGYIIEKVVKWREYYNGTKNEDGSFNRLTLEAAAEKVGISKKSLDDYLLQVRYGRKYGFNFNEHKNDKVGVLRAFVKKHMQSDNKNPKKKQQRKKKEKKNQSNQQM